VLSSGEARHLEDAAPGADGKDDLGGQQRSRRAVGEHEPTDGALAHDDASAREVEPDLVRRAAEEEAEADDQGHRDDGGDDEELAPAVGEGQPPDEHGGGDQHPPQWLHDVADRPQHADDAAAHRLDALPPALGRGGLPGATRGASASPSASDVGGVGATGAAASAGTPESSPRRRARARR
jgi:hypothetical protein